LIITNRSSSIMYAATALVAVLGLLTTSLAAPAPEPWQRGHSLGEFHGYHPRSSKKNSIASLEQPASDLPAPDGLTLKYLALGIGTQNYSCAATVDSSSAPVAVGAIATLYDLSPLMVMGTDMVEKLLPVIPGMALSFAGAANARKANLPNELRTMGVKPQALGNHFFTAAAVPTFALVDAIPEAQLNGKKTANVSAPAGSCPGLSGEGAVDWLYLSNAGGSFGGVSAVYRLETAGGASAKTCQGIGGNGSAGHVEVPYAAEYWFYG
jgi:hypothetical protein